MFSEANLYEKNKKEIIQDGRDYIHYLKTANKIKLSEKEKWDNGSYQLLGFASLGTEEFEEFIKYVKAVEKDMLVDNLPAAGNELLQLMTENFELFSRRIHLCNSEDQIYWNTPIFAYIDASVFVGKYLELSAKNKYELPIILEIRYNNISIANTLLEEFEWLGKVLLLLDVEYKKHDKKLSQYIFNSRIGPSFRKIIKNMSLVKGR